MDTFSPAVRSRVMARIRATDTAPEKRVRSALHRAGFRFTLHDRKLPGVPDIVLPSTRACVFVHGCFWHQCPKCGTGARSVTSNRSYWGPKLERNKARDIDAALSLKLGGWRVFVVWECETNGPRVGRLIRQLRSLRRGPT
jgi:DNA mismatch endonuclease (patch repair protein)